MTSNPSGGRSCLRTGCALVLVGFLLMALWVGYPFLIWTRARIPLPDGSGSVTYMARLRKILCAEWDRKVRIDTKRFHGVMACVPFDTCGAWPVKVYWYSAANGRGPYLRFRDPLNEYLVDLKHGKTLYVVRTGGNAYVGDISATGFRSWGTTTDSDGKEEGVTVNDRPARLLERSVASRPGQYLGRIDHPRRGFVSCKQKPEEALPEH